MRMIYYTWYISEAFACCDEGSNVHFFDLLEFVRQVYEGYLFTSIYTMILSICFANRRYLPSFEERKT